MVQWGVELVQLDKTEVKVHLAAHQLQVLIAHTKQVVTLVMGVAQPQLLLLTINLLTGEIITDKPVVLEPLVKLN